MTPPTPPAVAPTAAPAAIVALLALLRPLARLAVDHGVQFGQLEELLKRALVEAARRRDDGPVADGAVPASRISVMTGVHRKDVRRLAGTPGLDAVRAGSTLAAMLFTRWSTGAAWQRDGRPLRLPRRPPADGGPSFEALARGVTVDVHPRTLLDELLRLGLVAHDDADDTVALRTDTFVPATRVEALLGFLGDNVGDHLAAARANVAETLRAIRDGDPASARPPFVEQSLFADELSADSAALAVGDRIEVYGFADRAGGLLRATCIERRAAGDADGRVKLRGLIAELDAARGTFRIGTLQVDFRALRGIFGTPSGGLRNGLLVSIESVATPAAGAWRPDGEMTVLVATAATEGTLARVEGEILEFRSVAEFRVGGVPVDASRASFGDGLTAAALADDRRVRASGVFSGGRLLATRLEPRGDDDVSGETEDQAELEGTVVRFTRVADFAVRDGAGRVFLVDASLGTLVLEDGTTLADLRLGARVKVTGRRGTVIVATRLKVER